jgi:hypothetical protein
MRPAVARLILTVVLFAGWLGYLGYLVVCRPHAPSGLRGAFAGRPLTLSRPQFLVSTVDVVAEVKDDKGEQVVVKEVLFPKENAPVQEGETIRVEQIEECGGDYTGPGRYLLPLQSLDGAKGARRFSVTPTPPSPGFPSLQGVHVGLPHIYPATEEMLAEYRQIAKP